MTVSQGLHLHLVLTCVSVSGYIIWLMTSDPWFFACTPGINCYGEMLINGQLISEESVQEPSVYYAENIY